MRGGGPLTSWSWSSETPTLPVTVPGNRHVSTHPCRRLRRAEFHLADGTSALLTGLDVAFDSGRTGLIGRNGSGKSTLLRLVAGRCNRRRPSRPPATCSTCRRNCRSTGRTVADLLGIATVAAVRAISAGVVARPPSGGRRRLGRGGPRPRGSPSSGCRRGWTAPSAPCPAARRCWRASPGCCCAGRRSRCWTSRRTTSTGLRASSLRRGAHLARRADRGQPRPRPARMRGAHRRTSGRDGAHVRRDVLGLRAAAGHRAGRRGAAGTRRGG